MDKPFIPDVEMERFTPPSLYIPTEVCENIIDMLFSFNTRETLTNIATLHRCALVCRAWRVRSQRMLFYKVQLSDNTSFHRLTTIVNEAPHLRSYVYHMQLTGYYLHNTTSIFSLFPAVFAGKLPNLKRMDVVHFSETMEMEFPKTTVSLKAKSTPYIPLHRQFSALLLSFTAISTLYLEHTTFRSFSELPRMICALPNLQQFSCASVRWITAGGSHPGADFVQQPDWAAGRHTLPPFAPKIRTLMVRIILLLSPYGPMVMCLQLDDIAPYGVKRLISMNRLHLTHLALTIPLSDGPEEPDDGMYWTTHSPKEVVRDISLILL